jgi:hypothetical protein
MYAGVHVGEVCCVVPREELIFGVQVQVLFENILSGWNYKFEGVFGGEK